MARVRQARWCRAQRTRGGPCGNYAIVGGWVCRVHGGSSGKVRQAARIRRLELTLGRGFLMCWHRYLAELADWHQERARVVSELTGIPADKVDSMDIVLCHIDHGRPGLSDEAPVFRWDRRFGRRPPKTPSVVRACSE